MGRVVKVFPGRDGLARTVEVKTRASPSVSATYTEAVLAKGVRKPLSKRDLIIDTLLN